MRHEGPGKRPDPGSGSAGWNPPVRVDAPLDALLQSALVHNFIPVVDDRGAFIGIVTRKDILQWAITRAGCPKSALS